VQESALQPGAVAYIHDDIGMHIMGNHSPTERLVTLHIYSPPIKTCFVYQPDGTRKVAHLIAAQGIPHAFMEAPPAPLPVEEPPALDEAREKRQADEVIPMPQPMKRARSRVSRRCPALLSLPDGRRAQELVSLGAMVLTLKEQFDAGVSDEAMREVLAGVAFPRSEWENYVHFNDYSYVRILLAMVRCARARARVRACVRLRADETNGARRRSASRWYSSAGPAGNARRCTIMATAAPCGSRCRPPARPLACPPAGSLICVPTACCTGH
jgi:hypothetical protein